MCAFSAYSAFSLTLASWHKCALGMAYLELGRVQRASPGMEVEGEGPGRCEGHSEETAAGEGGTSLCVAQGQNHEDLIHVLSIYIQNIEPVCVNRCVYIINPHSDVYFL